MRQPQGRQHVRVKPSHPQSFLVVLMPEKPFRWCEACPCALLLCVVKRVSAHLLCVVKRVPVFAYCVLRLQVGSSNSP